MKIVGNNYTEMFEKIIFGYIQQHGDQDKVFYPSNITKCSDSKCDKFMAIMNSMLRYYEVLINSVEMLEDNYIREGIKLIYSRNTKCNEVEAENDLKEYLESIKKINISRFRIQTITSFCTSTDEELFEKPSLFNDFSIFEEKFCDDLKLSEKLYVILKIIEKNIRVIENTEVENAIPVDNRILKQFNDNDACSLINIYDEPENIKDIIKSDIGPQFLFNIAAKIKAEKKSIDDCIEISNKINEVYFKNVDNLKIDDIEKTEKLLIDFNVPAKVISYFKRENIDKINNEEKNKEILKKSNKVTCKVEKTKKYYNDSEFKKMKKEVEMYRDKMLESEEIDLQTEEIFRIAKNFVICFEDYEGAKNFLQYCNYYKKDQKDNPLSDYVHLYDRIKYYEKRFDMYFPLADSKECLDNMMICSPEDYLLYKQVLGESLSKMRSYMSGRYDYDYEISRMKK